MSRSCCRPLTNILSIQKRSILLNMVFLGIINSYILRSCVHVAITEMVIKEETAGKGNCTASNTVNISLKGPELKWNGHQQAAILASFLVGNALSHIAGYILIDKFGGHYILALGVLTSGLLTTIIPLAVVKGRWYAFCAIRFIVGMAQGPLFSGVAHIFSKWIPKQEQRKASLMAYLGPYIGNIFAYNGTAILMWFSKSWEVIYYVWGGLALFWFLLFMILCSPNPTNQIESRPRLKIAQRKMLCDGKTLGIISGWIGHSLAYFFINVSLPKYLKEVLSVNVVENGIMNSVFYACTGIGIFISIKAGEKVLPIYVSELNIRRSFIIFGNLAPCACLLAAWYVECDRFKVGILIALSGLVMGPTYFAVRSGIFKLTHNFGAAATVLVNGVGTLSYIPVPNIMAEVAKTNDRGEWKVIFLTLLFATLLTTIISVWKCTQQRAGWD